MIVLWREDRGASQDVCNVGCCRQTRPSVWAMPGPGRWHWLHCCTRLLAPVRHLLMLPNIRPSDTDQLTSIQDINLASSSFVIPWSYFMTALWSSCQASDKQALCSLHWLCSLLHGWGVTGVNDGNIILTLSHPLLKIKILLFICNIAVTNPIWPHLPTMTWLTDTWSPSMVLWPRDCWWLSCAGCRLWLWPLWRGRCLSDRLQLTALHSAAAAPTAALHSHSLQHCTDSEKADARPTYSIST